MSRERSNEGPARFDVRVIGTAELVLDGDRLAIFEAPRVQRLVGLLAIRGEPQNRARLAFELWPRSTDSQARTNLRKLLHQVRRTIPDVDRFVQTGDDMVALGPRPLVDVDLWRLRDAVAVGDLELAARLYRGDLLPACYDDWVIEERHRLRSEVHRILVEIAEQAAARHDHESTIRHCHRLLDHEPTDEVAVRLLMEAHRALGDRAAAVRAYQRCVETLARELDVVPGEAVAAVYRTLRADGPWVVDAPGPLDVPARAIASIAEAPFVGRRLELARLREAWANARAGNAHLLVVTGEPGIGKSRLAIELSREARADGYAVASARAFEAAGRLPWAPIVDLLRSEDLGPDVAALDPVWKVEIARLLPELADSPRAGVPVGSGDLGRRHRLFEAVGRAVAGERPRLLVVDDLQWCDSDTLEMIGYIVRAFGDAALLIVGTLRPEEAVDDHPLGRVLGALRRDEELSVVALERLDRAETLALAAHFATADTMEPELANRTWAETEGNPLFVIESLRARLVDADAPPVVTPTMRSVLQRRLSQLPDAPRQVAEIGAVVGRPFSVPLLASITGRPDGAVVEDVDELWRRRIIVDRGSSYDFSHDKLRAVALEGVSPARRRQLHQAVAETIEARPPDADASAAQVAAHYDQAGMSERAVDAYRRAGAQAVAVSSLDEAIAMFRNGLAALADLPPSSDRDAVEFDLQLALGSPLVAVKGYGAEEAYRLYERARVLSRRLDRSVAPPVLRGLGLALIQGCRFGDADEMSEALLRHGERDTAARTEGHYLLGVSAFWRGDLRVARRNLESALADYEPARLDEHLTRYAQDPRAICLVRLAWLELWEGEARLADERARAAIALADDLDHQMTSAYVGIYAAVIAAEADDIDRLEELLDRLDLIWNRCPLPYMMILGDALRGWFEVTSGATEGIERIVTSSAAARHDGETLHLTYCLLLLARARYRAGESREGRAATTEALVHSRRWTQHYLEAELLRVDGELAYQSGETGAAADALRAAVELADAQGAGWAKLRALISLVSRFPAPETRLALARLVEHMPSGDDLPPFRDARALLAGS